MSMSMSPAVFPRAPHSTRPATSTSTSRPSSPAPATTPVELTIETLRGSHRPLILWHLFWGERPFSELMRRTPGISKKDLRRELAEMEKLGLLRREVRIASNRKADYSLTLLGQTLKPLVAAMYEWGLGRLKARGKLRPSRAGAARTPSSSACAGRPPTTDRALVWSFPAREASGGRTHVVDSASEEEIVP